MAQKYWVGGTGNLDGSTTTHISDSDGGAGGAVYPSTSDTLNFTASSGGGTVTFTATANFAAISTSGSDGQTINTNGQAVNLSGSLTISASTKTLNFGASVITVGGVSTFTAFGSGTTINAGTSSIVTAGSFVGNVGFTWYDLTFSSVTSQSLNASGTFHNVTATGAASKTAALDIRGDITVNGTLTLNGNSATNRLLIWAFARGTTRTVTAATVSVTNADFQDIVGAGAGSWNLSAITGGSGDCGGNSGITFTSPATQYWQHGASASYNWSDSTRWFLGSGGTGGAGRVPLPQDSAIFDSASFGATGKTVTMDMPRLPAFDWTGVVNSPTFSSPGTAPSLFGSIIFASGMTFSGATTWTYEGRGSSLFDPGGHTWGLIFNIRAPGGKLTLAGPWINTSTFNYFQGGFDDGGYDVTIASGGDSGSLARALTASGIWTITSGTTTNLWFMTATNNTVALTGTFRFTGALTADRNVYFGGLSVGRFENATTGSFALWLNNSATYPSGFEVDASAGAKSLKFAVGTTHTVGDMTRDGGTNGITIDTTTGSGTFNLVKLGGGTVVLHGMAIRGSTVTPAHDFKAINSTDNGSNTGWDFDTEVYASYSAVASVSGLMAGLAADSNLPSAPAVAIFTEPSPSTPSAGISVSSYPAMLIAPNQGLSYISTLTGGIKLSSVTLVEDIRLEASVTLSPDAW